MNVINSTKPNAMSDLSTWLHYLERIHPQTIEMGLERVTSVARKLNVLKPAPYIFTVAGTNGKGTTCRAIEMILLEAGFKVGVYSSPHLLRYTERVRINNQELTEVEHVKAFDFIEQQREDTSLTYFEYSTLSALYLFKQAELDIVILEVGLGGRLDATNIVDADVAVITSIAIDHVEYLGDNRESIGFEKAGIFKPKCTAVVGEPDMPTSIYQVAQKQHVALHCVSPNSEYDWNYCENSNNTWSFSSAIKTLHQLPMVNIPLANAATALAAISYSELKIDDDVIYNGLIKTQLVGRFQIINRSPLVIIDVAHNPHASAYLQHQLDKLIKTTSNHKQLRMVIGMLKDKDIASTIKNLSADVWYCATLYGPRGATAKVLAETLDTNQKVYQFNSVQEAYQQAMCDADNNDIIVICGSFHTVAEALSLDQNE